MATRKTRIQRLQSTAQRFAANPIVIDGDAVELLEILRSGSRESGFEVADRASLSAAGAKRARIAILAIDGDGRLSSFARASKLLREMDSVIADDAIRIVVVQSGRSRIAPQRLQALLASEILYQVTLAASDAAERQKWRSIRQRLGLFTLDAAGIRVLRFG